MRCSVTSDDLHTDNTRTGALDISRVDW